MLYGLMGHPVHASRSPLIHRAFAEQMQVEQVYQVMDVPLADFSASVNDFRLAGGLGLSVTLPLKVVAYGLASVVLPAAKQVGAANTLKWTDGVWQADNTDGLGFMADLCDRLGYDVRGASVLLLGAGGASRGIVPSLLAAGPRSLVVVNRTVAKAAALCAAFSSGGISLASHADDDLPVGPFDLIVCATSCGHQGLCPSVSESWIGENTVVYDLSYAKAAQPFLTWARSKGVTAAYDGFGMLCAQAAYQFAWWHGVQPDWSRVYAALR
jgi:shikimate dehydrogenase